MAGSCQLCQRPCSAGGHRVTNGRYHPTAFGSGADHGVDPTLNIGDITKADEKVVPDFNVMFGGSPCQDFSIAGKQGGGCMDL